MLCSQVTLVWPKGSVPPEIFDQIVRHLQFSDVRNMRLVCREFCEKISANFVYTLAVQFRPEFCLPPPGVSWPLQGHGPTLLSRYKHHIRRFMVSLEVNEDELSCLPIKPDQKLVSSFWGVYLWHNDGQNRYPGLLRLETAADNTSGIKSTLRSLVNVPDIAISCDPGWGRLLGPERQHVAASVFGDRYQAIGLPIIRDRPPFQHTRLPELPKTFTEDAIQRRLSALKNMVLGACIAEGNVDSILASVDGKAILAALDSALPLKESEPGLIPTRLSLSQKEFLMELEWASRAFIQSCAVAISDLSWEGDFRHLTCLRLSKIPSSHLHILTDFRFWAVLPTVNEVHLQVLANWRRLARDQDTGVVSDEPVEPVEAVADTFKLLRLISEQRNITTLHFEWLCGGELSWGSQRGRYILPLPFTRRPEFMAKADMWFDAAHILSVPHITKLSLKNCWCSPQVFIHVIRDMARNSLVDLKLESVSLSGPTMTLTNAVGGRPPLRQRLEAFANFGYEAPFPIFPPSMLEPVHPGAPVSVPALAQMLTPDPNADAPPGHVPANQPRPSVSSLFSWPGIINVLGSGPKSPAFFNPSNPGPTIERMEFKSCGYVAVEHPYIKTSRLATWKYLADHYHWVSYELQNPSLLLRTSPAGPTARFRPLPTTPQGMENGTMQSSWSELDGWVVPRLPDDEEAALMDVFGMRMGWEGVYDEQTVALAKAVNPTEPGEGRFSGVVCRKGGS